MALQSLWERCPNSLEEMFAASKPHGFDPRPTFVVHFRCHTLRASTSNLPTHFRPAELVARLESMLSARLPLTSATTQSPLRRGPNRLWCRCVAVNQLATEMEDRRVRQPRSKLLLFQVKRIPLPAAQPQTNRILPMNLPSLGSILLSRTALRSTILSAALGLWSVCAWCFPAAAEEEVFLEAVADATLYEDLGGALANGSGDYLFTGIGNEIKRALIAFDLSALPPDSLVLEAELTLHMSRTIVGARAQSLHRVTLPWGEGDSNAAGEEGGGTAATAGDATWLYRFFALQTWNTPGGDFVAAASAHSVVDGIGFYTWSSTPELIADVGKWVADPSSNHGWVLLGNESPTGQTAKRYDSRTNANPAFRPVLRVVTERPVVAVPATSSTGLVGMVLLLAGGTVLILRAARPPG